MPSDIESLRSELKLRERAAFRINRPGSAAAPGCGVSSSPALAILHKLASASATAPEALALLHELQVHQVELEMQAEELRASRAESETLLNRQVLLFEGSPAATFIIDGTTAITELNRAAARMLHLPSDVAVGIRLNSLLSPTGQERLDALLRRAAEGPEAAMCDLRFDVSDIGACEVRLAASVDTCAPRYILVALPFSPDGVGPAC